MVNTSEKNVTNGNDKEKLDQSATPPVPQKAKLTEVDKNLRDLEDPLCSPNNIQKITFQDVTTAAFLIKGGVEYTPCPVMIYDLRVQFSKTYFILLLEITIIWSSRDVNLSQEGIPSVHWKVSRCYQW